MKLCDGRKLAALRATPDGESLLVESNVSGDIEIYRVGLDGGEPERLTFHPGRDSHPQ